MGGLEDPRPPTRHQELDAAKQVVRARRRYLGTKEGRAYALRALIKILNSEAAATDHLRALDSARRLGGESAAGKIITELGRAPARKLTPEERTQRLNEGRKARSLRLARRAERELGKAQKRLKAAQVAVARAEASIRKWAGKVAYHREHGRLPPEKDDT